MKTALLTLTALALGQGVFTINDGAVRTRGGMEMDRTLATNGDAGVAGQLLVLGDAGVRGQLLVRGDAGFHLLYSNTNFQLMVIGTSGPNNPQVPPVVYGSTRVEQAFEVRQVCLWVSNVAGAGTNNVMRVTDGSNNCDSTYSCGSVLNSTGQKCVAPTGTCTFAAGSNLYVYETTGGCTPDPTLRSISVLGSYR